jgi:hypothetical protein
MSWTSVALDRREVALADHGAGNFSAELYQPPLDCSLSL